MKVLFKILCFLIFLAPVISNAQEKVTFYSIDSLEITADLYEIDKNYPYIILFHQVGGSRGEYNVLAKRLVKLGYNCLAVDLRNGEESNFVKNETAEKAKEKKVPCGLEDTQNDILAAIDYIFYKNYREVILFGSSFSASLCLKTAKGNPKIKAVVAFSPGEFFLPDTEIKYEIKGLKKPVFVASSVKEYPYMLELFVNVSSEYKTIFKPMKGEGAYGTKSLTDECDSSDEYWLELLMFFRKLK
ncbi:MAG: hypothetical protein A2W91_16560 [Bacteroidetes bacterium GWF2_38_335]|nr:MAG: hypothetical protein A2W91_16560 [Bacteroidetes bacterium GWF2_38_335]OFY81300.1 MAG: hypothetical protein A2281_07535 [Bacteroidetes bacterium RIFOXYA12_FULL_38_20]HBS85420.1 hypothetical protein [Bacteroidales bacterium]